MRYNVFLIHKGEDVPLITDNEWNVVNFLRFWNLYRGSSQITIITADNPTKYTVIYRGKAIDFKGF